MSDDTQNRLKAFLARNRSRINGPGADTSDISNAYFSGSSTKTDADKLDMIQNISHSTKFHENSNKTLAQSLDEKRSGREFEGVSFEYQPISLFDVIGNTPYSEAHDSTRNNSILQSEQVRVQGHDLYSVVNTSPGRQSDRNAEYDPQLASFRRHENDVILNEEHNNAMVNTNKPASVSKSSKKDIVSGKKTSPSKDVKKETQSSPSGTKAHQTNSQAVKDIKEQGASNKNKVEPEKSQQQQQLQQQEQQPSVIEKVEEIKGRTGSMSFNGSIKGGSQVFEEAEPVVNYQPPKENKIVEVERRQNSPEIEKKKSVSPAKKVKEGNSGGSGEKVKGVFSESSKKLNALNDNTPNDSEFKKEIKNLIKVIKQEKEQVVEELKLMAEDLNKYKSAFKKLQKQKGTKPSDPGFGSPKRDSVENKKSFSPERQGPSSGSKSNRAVSPSQKSPDKGGFENIQGLDLKDLISASELKKDPINEFVIKDMNLNPKLFFKDEERLATDPNIKPTIVDLVASQREIINFLVKRYQTAEHNRLKTEEQASKVVLSLENAVKKLDKKDSLSRTRTSLSPINSRRRVNMTDQI